MGNRTVLAVLLNTVNHSYNNLPKGRGRNTWNECVKVEKKMLGLVKDDAHNREKRRSVCVCWGFCLAGRCRHNKDD